MIRLRRVSPNDEAMILVWQREPGARRYSRNPAIPSVAEHARWMQDLLADPRRQLNVIEYEGEAAGIVRCDDCGDGCTEVSILVAASFQGKGVGQAALQEIRRQMPSVLLVAEVHPDNRASHRIFMAAGYNWTGTRYECPPTFLKKPEVGR